MDKSAILRFLQAIDEELVLHAKKGERLDLYLLGGGGHPVGIPV